MAGGRAEQIDVPVSPPLGLHLMPFTEHTVSLPPGATLVAFTDGLVERRGASIQTGIDSLRDVITSSPYGSAAAAVESAVRMLDDEEGHEDDIAIIAIKLSATTGAEPENSLELTDADHILIDPEATPALAEPELLS
jgi:hypothetical protein